MFSLVQHPLFGQCVQLSTDKSELLITLEVGPRIISCRFAGQELFYHNPLDFQKREGWCLYGGHRLWHAPEAKPRTYHLDNSAVDFSTSAEVLIFKTPPDTLSGVAKQIAVSVLPTPAIASYPVIAGYRVEHTLTNTTWWPLTLAPWAITVFTAQTKALLPLGNYIPHSEEVLPVNQLTLWGYTDLSDPRFSFVPGALYLTQAQGAEQKIGAFVKEGYCAASVNDILFLKIFNVLPKAIYPDRGANVEIFTNDLLLELETLAHLRELAPGESAKHTELWFITKRSQESLLEQARELFYQLRHHNPSVVV